MLFNSFQFLWLFPLIFAAIQFTPPIIVKLCKIPLRKVSNSLLLFISYALYISYQPIYALVLLYVTAVTYFGALYVSRHQEDGRKKRMITVSAFGALFPLLLFKYYNFINDSLIGLFNTIGIHANMPGLNWAIPLGISFFTFQAVGYLWDVYYKRIEVEHNWWDFMLFVSFFPQIASGPISKAKDLLPQIKAERKFDYDRAVQGCKWLLWGMFLKVVMADRIGTMVDTILPNYMYLSGPTCAVGAVLYSIQIYGDFAGYSLMAIGAGRLMGFDLINNFHRPYFAATITEFWRRWHISLTKWLTDYVYIPLGGSRCSKVKTYRNIFVTFLVSGIWHGANWTFVIWGMMHGALQVIEKALGCQKCENRRVRPFRIVLTFILVTLAWVFFRMPTIEEGWGVVSKIFTDFNSLAIKATKTDLLFIFGSLLTVFIVEWMEEYLPKVTLLNNKKKMVRWVTYIVLLIVVLLCGVFDAGSFIYVSF